MSLDIRIDPPSGGKQKVAIGGRLDTNSFGQLDQALAPVLADTALHSLVLDLTGLEYISSAGIRSLFKARKALAARNGRVLVTNVQPQIQKVFDVVKAVPMNQVFASVAEADAYLDAMQRRVLHPEDADDELR
jgi:anti-anti-sigma factor